MRTLNSAFGIGVLALALSTGAAACGPTVLEYHPSGINNAVGVDSDIKATPDRDHSLTQLEVKVRNLPAPSRFGDGNTAFVVWIRGNPSNPWTKIGTLAYNASSREGDLVTSAAQNDFDLQITVEADPNPGSPSTNVILQQRVGEAAPGPAAAGTS